MSSTPPQSSPRRTLRRALIAAASLGLLTLLGLFIYLRNFHLPAPTGQYAVGTTILELTDSTRHEDHESDPAARRNVVVQLWYPAQPSNNPIARYKRWSEATAATFFTPLLSTNSRVDAPIANAAAPFPVLLFGHRWGGQRTQNTDLAEDLASHGYVVAAIDHPYNSARVQLADGRVIHGGEPIQGPGGTTASPDHQIAFWNKTLDLWAADDLFALNYLASLNANPSSQFHNHLDAAHAAAFGHSFGGAASERLLGLDPRIKAAINMDGWTFGGLDRRSTQPILILEEQSNRDRRTQLLTLPEPGSPDDQLDRADIAAVSRSLSQFGGYRLQVAGTQHLDFSDQPLLPPLRRLAYTGPISPARLEPILRQTVLQFFDQALRGQKPKVLDPNQHEFPELTVEIWPTKPPAQP